MSLRGLLLKLRLRAALPGWRKGLGSEGERIASRHLRRRGLHILSRNFLCPFGEIDLIASDGESLIFVEVKTRWSPQSGADVPVHPSQQRSLAKSAQAFISLTGSSPRPCRFDVVEVTFDQTGEHRLEHTENAFQVRVRGDAAVV